MIGSPAAKAVSDVAFALVLLALLGVGVMLGVMLASAGALSWSLGLGGTLLVGLVVGFVACLVGLAGVMLDPEAAADVEAASSVKDPLTPDTRHDGGLWWDHELPGWRS